MPSTTKATTVTRNRSLTFLAGAAVIPLAALAVAGCGSASGGSAAVPAPKTASGQAAAVGVATTRLGKTLVDSKGRTLYAFGHDLKNKSRCSGACASNWPPALSPAKPKVGAGIKSAKLRVIKRSDGGRQLSYAGHPLYRYAGDSKAGDVNGQGLNFFGGVWNVMSGSGKVVTGSSQSQSSTPSSGGGYSPGGGY